MTLGFTYKGIHSNVYKIVANITDRSLLPSLLRREISIPSRHGVYDFGNNRYDKRLIPGQLQYIGNDIAELRRRAREISAWLTSEQYEPLIFDDEPDKMYLARIYDAVSFENLARIGRASVQFECQPMAQYVVSTGEDVTLDSYLPLDSDILLNPVDSFTFEVTSSPTEITFENWGTTDINYKSQAGALSKIIITGSFVTFSITLNGKTLNYNEAVSNGTVTIDNVNCTVKLGETNKLSVVTGDLASFLKLIPGTNTATITGTDLNCSVLFDFIPLYI